MRKISCKEFFVTLFVGLWQAVLWGVGLFGCKDESLFAKVLKRIFALCATILMMLFTGCMLYAFARNVVYEKWIGSGVDGRVAWKKYISNSIVYQYLYASDEGRVYDENKGKILLEKVDWVITSDDRDSLAVFARSGKRGYLNRFTGEVVIPEVYTRAWTFSEGLAAVEKNGELLFIDRTGKVVIDKDFEVYFDDPEYVFENGYCVVRNAVNGKMGLIDKTGNWVLKDEYDNLFNNEGFWQVEKEERVGLYTPDVKMMFPVENTGIFVYNDIIEVRCTDHVGRRYDWEGKLLMDFVIDEVSNLQYETTELCKPSDSADGEWTDNRVYGVANCQQYLVRSGSSNTPDYYGLMDRQGKRVTPPVYTSITAIGKDCYLCQPDGVIINDRGEKVE